MITRPFIIFTIIYIIIIIAFGIVAYQLEKKKLADQGKQIDIRDFLNNNNKLSPRVVIIGLIFGIIFGLMDNVSLYFGIDGFGDYLREKFGMSDIEVAGYSNTYSGVLGVTLATFAVIISSYYYPDVNQSNRPVWSNTIGFLIGAIIGIYIPKLIFRK